MIYPLVPLVWQYHSQGLSGRYALLALGRGPMPPVGDVPLKHRTEVAWPIENKQVPSPSENQGVNVLLGLYALHLWWEYQPNDL